jgi:copper chaperone CopZ
MIRFTGLLMLVLSNATLIGCAESTRESAASAVEATPTAFNVAGDPTIEFNAPDMMCPEGCGEKVKEILSERPGAKEVVVNFEEKTATVAVDADKFDADAAIAALVDYGFDHSTLKTADLKAAPATEPAVPVTEPAEPPAG